MVLGFEGLAGVPTGGHAYSDVEELEVEAAIDLATDDAICLDDFLDVMVDEIVIRVDVLLDKTWRRRMSKVGGQRKRAREAADIPLTFKKAGRSWYLSSLVEMGSVSFLPL